MSVKKGTRGILCGWLWIKFRLFNKVNIFSYTFKSKHMAPAPVDEKGEFCGKSNTSIRIKFIYSVSDSGSSSTSTEL